MDQQDGESLRIGINESSTPSYSFGISVIFPVGSSISYALHDFDAQTIGTSILSFSWWRGKKEFVLPMESVRHGTKMVGIKETSCQTIL